MCWFPVWHIWGEESDSSVSPPQQPSHDTEPGEECLPYSLVPSAQQNHQNGKFERTAPPEETVSWLIFFSNWIRCVRIMTTLPFMIHVTLLLNLNNYFESYSMFALRRSGFIYSQFIPVNLSFDILLRKVQLWRCSCENYVCILNYILS